VAGASALQFITLKEVVARMIRFGCFSQLLLASLLFASFGAARCEVRLPHMLSDHAVLQREMPVHIWGWAGAGEKVTVSFRGQTRMGVADDLGRWSVFLRPEQAGGPYALTVQGSNTIRLEDILVGDVWFASGQSNMEFPLDGFPGLAVLKNGPQEIAAATQPQIRLLRFGRKASEYELRDQDASWTLCTPETAAQFSAVAYFFARDLVKQERVPIGLIDSTWGGTPVAAWLSLDGLSSDAGLMPQFAQRVEMVENQSDISPMLDAEKREDAKARAAGQALTKHPWHPNPASWAPTELFNGMVAPAIDFAIKGVIWYQGETDSTAGRAPLYERTFPAMITDWRARWGEGNFPFLFVQLSSFTSTPAETWGVVREAQRRTLKLANTGMAVSVDVGQADNVHPTDKQTVGTRLALAARAVAYGEAVEFSGPLFREATPEGNGMRVYFTHGQGLVARGGALEGFEVAGEDRRFRPGTARVDGDTVVVNAADVSRPMYVRYAWANAPLTANLYNGAGLPAAAFTSEMHIPVPCAGSCGSR
jgi:sialate O-acetylesterase